MISTSMLRRTTQARRSLIAVTLALVLGAAAILHARPVAADYSSGVDAFERGDHVAALRELEPLARSGNASAQYYVGVILADGRAGVRDPLTAYYMLACAVEKSNSIVIQASALQARERLGVQLGADQARQILDQARAECGSGGVSYLPRGGSPTALYSPKRNGVVPSVFFFMGDLTIWGLLAIAGAFGFDWLRKVVMALHESLHIWFVAILSLLWWGLLLRILVVLAAAFTASGPHQIHDPFLPPPKPGPVRSLVRRWFGGSQDDDYTAAR